MSWSSIRNPYQGATIVDEIDRLEGFLGRPDNVTAASTVNMLVRAKAVLLGTAENSAELIIELSERAKASKLHQSTLNHVVFLLMKDAE